MAVPQGTGRPTFGCPVFVSHSNAAAEALFLSPLRRGCESLMIAGPVNYGSLWTDLALLVLVTAATVAAVYAILRVVGRRR